MQPLRKKKLISFGKTMKEKIAVSILPEDVINIIFLMLPAKSIMRFRCVCKLWLEKLEKPDFIHMHLNHAVENNKYNVFLNTYCLYGPASCYYRVDFDGATASSLSDKAVKVDLPSSIQCRFVGSCNGILCFSRYNLSNSLTICLWNPCTQGYREIIKQSCSRYVVAYGFGYDRKINDYKLILIFKGESWLSDSLSEMHVYTLGSSSWKKIGNTPCVYHGTGADMCYSLKPLNGAMHWLARKVTVTDDQQAVTIVILSFDIVEEKTKEMETPIASCILNEESKLKSLGVGVLEKHLYLSICVSDIFELWVMKDYGVVDSWTMFLSIPNYWGSAMPLSFNGEIILLTCYCSQGNQVKNALVSYDLRNRRSTLLNIKDMPARFTAETFMDSLVSLNQEAH